MSVFPDFCLLSWASLPFWVSYTVPFVHRQIYITTFCTVCLTLDLIEFLKNKCICFCLFLIRLLCLNRVTKLKYQFIKKTTKLNVTTNLYSLWSYSNRNNQKLYFKNVCNNISKNKQLIAITWTRHLQNRLSKVIMMY